MAHFVGAVKAHMERLAKLKATPPPLPPILLPPPLVNNERQILHVITKTTGRYPWVGKATGV